MKNPFRHLIFLIALTPLSLVSGWLMTQGNWAGVTYTVIFTSVLVLYLTDPSLWRSHLDRDDQEPSGLDIESDEKYR